VRTRRLTLSICLVRPTYVAIYHTHEVVNPTHKVVNPAPLDIDPKEVAASGITRTFGSTKSDGTDGSR
jgi:hypothetical protein